LQNSWQLPPPTVHVFETPPCTCLALEEMEGDSMECLYCGKPQNEMKTAILPTTGIKNWNITSITWKEYGLAKENKW